MSLRTFNPARQVYFISTHLDDVILSCSHYISANPGVFVITALAGAPPVYKDQNDWNVRTTGKNYAPEALKVRKLEDAKAMAVLKAKPIWAELPEALYVKDGKQDELTIANELERVLKKEQPHSVVFPVGLHHSDHIAVSNACIKLVENFDLDWYLYLDMPYANKLSHYVETRLTEIANTGKKVETLEPFQSKSSIKYEAFKLYSSQFQPIKDAFSDFDESMTAPELYWQLWSV